MRHRLPRFRSLLLATCPLLLPAVPVAAQEAQTEDDTASDGGVGDIIVTAQRREQNLQDVPIAVTTVSANQLSAQGVAELKDITATVPNLVLAAGSSSPSAVRAFMRGAGSNDSLTATTEQAVGFYIDDIYQARGGGLNLELPDIERIEILRGPQGTLYGRNTMVGALKVVTYRPGSTVRIEADATYGSYDYWRVRGLLAGPISDSFSASLSGLWTKRDGRTFNRALGIHVNNREASNIRATLRYHGDPEWDIILRAGHMRDSGDGMTATPLAPGTKMEPLYGSMFETSALQRAFSRYRETNANIDATWKPDGFNLQYIGSLIWIDNDVSADLTGGQRPDLGMMDDTLDNKQMSHELKFQPDGLFNDHVDLLMGAYAFHEKSNGRIGSGLPTSYTRLDRASTTSYALFGQATVNFTERFSATLGGRWTHDRKILQAVLANGAIVDARKSFSEVTPKIDVQFKVSKDIMVYASYSSGFKGGGFNGRALNALAMSTPFEAEKVQAWEAGVKSELFDRKLRLNIAYFYNNFKDLQLTNFVGAGNATLISNAGGAVVQGVEAEATAAITSNFRLIGTLSTMADHYKNLEPSSQPVRLNSTDVPSTPALSWSAGFNWDKYFDGFGKIAVGSTVAYRADYQLGVSPVPRLRVPSVYLVNANIEWESEDERWGLILAATNLANEHYQETAIQIGTAAAVVPAKPREWKLTLRHKF